MTERTFRIILGASLLLGLYFELHPLVLGIIGLLAFQGVTNWRVTNIVSRLYRGNTQPLGPCCAASEGGMNARFDFEAERALCLIVVLILLPSYTLYREILWFIPWFIGFALFGAGLSGICPMIMALRRVGFK